MRRATSLPSGPLGLLAILATGAFACSSAPESDDAAQDLTATCTPPPPACDGAAPTVSAVGFHHFRNIFRTFGDAHHRGRDLLLKSGDPAYALGKFAYGKGDGDLNDEDVKVFLDRGCTGRWEDLGVHRTSSEGDAPKFAGFPADGGRVSFRIPGSLPAGRHRVHMVALGDGTSTDQFIEVLPAGAKVFVSDVDGTLTSSENVELLSLVTHQISEAHRYAPEALSALAQKGYRPVYITARPEWLVPRTREFLKARGFPPGTVHTSLGLVPLTGTPAATFKKGELEAIRSKGFRIQYAIGNRDTDADAFLGAAGVDKKHCVLFQLDTAEANGCRRFDAYNELLQEAKMLPACR